MRGSDWIRATRKVILLSSLTGGMIFPAMKARLGLSWAPTLYPGPWVRVTANITTSFLFFLSTGKSSQFQSTPFVILKRMKFS